MNVAASVNFVGLNTEKNINMNFNFLNNDRTTTNPRQSVFGNTNYKPIEWSQVTPQQMPWAQNPSQYAPVMTFGSPNFFQQPGTTPPTTPSGPSTETFSTSPSQQHNVSFNISPQTSDFNNLLTANKPSTNVKRNGGHGIISRQYQFAGAIHCKRKSDIGINAPAKQHITEERMAAHLSKLHISSETPITTTGEDGNETEPPVERERRLVMCEEMRRLQTESIIPSALMRRSTKHVETWQEMPSPPLPISDNFADKYSSRLERPCMAVMLWQPPDKAGRLPPIPSTSYDGPSTSGESNNNNNTLNINLNRSHTHDTDDTDEEVEAEQASAVVAPGGVGLEQMEMDDL